jgi:hypothetical protein
MRILDDLKLTSSIKNELYCELLPVVEQKVCDDSSSLRKGIQDLKGVLASSVQQIAE